MQEVMAEVELATGASNCDDTIREWSSKDEDEEWADISES